MGNQIKIALRYKRQFLKKKLKLFKEILRLEENHEAILYPPRILDFRV